MLIERIHQITLLCRHRVSQWYARSALALGRTRGARYRRGSHAYKRTQHTSVGRAISLDPPPPATPTNSYTAAFLHLAKATPTYPQKTPEFPPHPKIPKIPNHQKPLDTSTQKIPEKTTRKNNRQSNPMPLPYDLSELLPVAPELLTAIELMNQEEEKRNCEKDLRTFLKTAWPYFDSSPFTTNWHLEAIAEHLMAVTNGQIKRLVVNVPPRTGKTNLVAIAWPVWTWTLQPDPTNPLKGPGVRFLCASYGATKAEADGVTARRLIGTKWFQSRWGDHVKIAKDRDNQSQYDTTQGGSRISTGIPESLGKGGAIRIVDDPHKTDEVESDLIRQSVIRAYDEVWRTRSNDPQDGAEVIIMQRLAEADLSGHVISEPGIVHLMLPMEYDSRRHCHTVISLAEPEPKTFDDPRTTDNELLWPSRFDQNWVNRQKRLMGPHAWAGQFNQIPTARGGGIIQRDWWQLWPPSNQEDAWYADYQDEDGNLKKRLLYPDLDYVLISVDPAYGEREESDWSACTVWGSFELPMATITKNSTYPNQRNDPASPIASHISTLDDATVYVQTLGQPRLILLEAWRERMELRRLTMKIIDTARRRKADGVLIESKASGLSVIQEMRRLMRVDEGDTWTIFAEAPKGDKIARLHAVSAAFSAGLIYAPDRKWSDLVIDEVSQFPRSKFKDLTDTVSAAIKKLRDLNIVRHPAEVDNDRLASLTFVGHKPSVRELYGV